MTNHPATGRLTRAIADFDTRLAAVSVRDGGVSVIPCDPTVRIPTAFLARERELVGHRWALTGLSEASVVALALLGVADAYGVAVPAEHHALIEDPPCALELMPDGVLVATPVAGVATHPRMGATMAHAWMEGLAPVAVVVDLGAVTHLTSVVIAWQLQLLQCSRPAPFSVRHANQGVRTQLKQLRLDYLMALS